MKMWRLKRVDTGEIMSQEEDGFVVGFYKTKKKALADRHMWYTEDMDTSIIPVRVEITEIPPKPRQTIPDPERRGIVL